MPPAPDVPAPPPRADGHGTSCGRMVERPSCASAATVTVAAMASAASVRRRIRGSVIASPRSHRIPGGDSSTHQEPRTTDYDLPTTNYQPPTTNHETSHRRDPRRRDRQGSRARGHARARGGGPPLRVHLRLDHLRLEL